MGDGQGPQIVFDERVPDDSYFPDWAYWDSAISPDAPAGAPHTSGLCQPPVHALALLRIWQLAQRSCEGGRLSEVRDRARALSPRVLAWHRYLATARDPEGSGLVTIYHPWESGADNSPRWDRALANVEVGKLASFRRRDTEHVRDASQRPTDRDYERYIWLVKVLKACRYDEADIHRRHPFLVKDVFFSAILVCANVALLELAEALGADDLSPAVGEWVAAGRRGVAGQWDDELGLCVDYDVLAANPFTGEPLGSPRQSWTAAVTLDWLSFAVGAAAPGKPV
jgi:hypothetical protein